MSFDADRVDRSLLARVDFGEAWLALADPRDGARCDAFDVRDRMALYRLLVERCNTRGGFGDRQERSPFWGYASQLAWQHRSGRLAATAGANGYAIDPCSWWGACNYALSVVPYAAAVQAGCVPLVAIEPCASGARADLVCQRDGAIVEPRVFVHAFACWRDAVRTMAALRAGDDLEPVRFAVWRAHLASIHAAIDAHAVSFAAMPRAEQRFARGWVRMVEIFGAGAMPTDLVVLAKSTAGTLPARPLTDERTIGNLPRAQQRTVRHVWALADRPAWRWEIDTRVWQRIMRSRAARSELDALLAGILGTGRRAWIGRAKALAYAALPERVLRRIDALRA